MSDPVKSDFKSEFEDLFTHAPCGYLTVSPESRVTRANLRIAGWIGISASELTGKKFSDLLSVASRIFFETNVSPLLHMQGYVDEVAMDFVTHEGVKVQCLVNAAERRDSEGKLSFTRYTIFAATERRRYERTLVESRALTERAVDVERANSELREQFIAVLGHDLRNPLASINSGVRLLTQREILSDSGQRILSLMQGSVARASELVDNVLDFARGRLGGGVTLDRDGTAPLQPVLEQVVAELQSINPVRDIQTTFNIVEPVDCDRVRIGQLLSNLLSNAITYGSSAAPIFVDATTNLQNLKLSISNSGAAIGEDTMARLFQPFFRGEARPNQAGLGLGLHIASEIAKAHGGTLAVSSNADETRFTFLMPLQA